MLKDFAWQGFELSVVKKYRSGRSPLYRVGSVENEEALSIIWSRSHDFFMIGVSYPF